MDHKLKNVFWLSGKNPDGYDKFIPIMFNTELNKIYLVKNKYTIIFTSSLSTNDVVKKITKVSRNNTCKILQNLTSESE